MCRIIADAEPWYADIILTECTDREKTEKGRTSAQGADRKRSTIETHYRILPLTKKGLDVLTSYPLSVQI